MNSNVNKAKAYFTAVNNYDVDTIERMVHESYIQHNPFVPTGRAAFLALLPKLKSFGTKIKNIRMIEDGPYVVMHHKWENALPFGHQEIAAFHIIRFDNTGLIAEHWSVMTKDICSMASSLSLTDGSVEIKDRHKTNAHQMIIKNIFYHLINNKEATVDYPVFLKDRLSRLNITYLKQHKIFAEGNFVLSISEALCHGKLSAVYDLFHFENEKITEHWAVIQEIPIKGTLNNNSMFGF